MQRQSVLIVDDIITNIMILSAVLKKEGYDVYETTSGSEVVEIAKEVHPTLILLDIMMPEIDGFETCKILKEEESTKDIPIIFVTAKSDDNDKVKGLEMGAVDYITKPYFKKEVVARVKTHIDLEEAKMSLADSERRYHSLVDGIQDGIFLWQPEEGVVFCNPTFCDLLNLSFGDIKGSGLDRFFLGNSLLAARSAFEATYKIGDRSFEGLDLVTSCSAHYMIRVSCKSVLIDYDGCKTVLVTLQDITEKERFEKRLRQSQKMEAMGALTSGIARDFNNSLSIVNGYAELAMINLDKDSEMYNYLKLISTAGRNAASLTKSLLSFVRKKNIHIQTAEISREIEEVQGFLGHSLPVGVTLSVNSLDVPVYCDLDVGMFQQVIVNMCINSSDAMPRDGDILIDISRVTFSEDRTLKFTELKAGRFVKIDVRDTGEGGPDDIKEKVFAPFFTTKADEHAAGLGLAMAVSIIQDQGGWIDLDSERGVGSVFSIFLPESDQVEEKK